MTTSKSMQPIVPNRIVIKLGGSMLEGLNEEFFANFKKLQAEGNEIIIVHGGGPAINKSLADHGVTSTTINGFRVTSEEAVDIVQCTLVGKVNPSLVLQLNQNGIAALGMSGYDGNLLECDFLDKEIYGFVGEIKKVNTPILEILLVNGITPVISCIGCLPDSTPLNINADTVASKIALAIKAECLLLVTDTPGIKINGEIQEVVQTSSINKWIESEDIYGGMIPKVNAAMDCLKEGIPSVKIVDEQLHGTTIVHQEVYV
ncbi:acetylglutamate kinase [Psychrobacillus sp. AK 1817]|uniref:acetylglutamate kinase n=1 Tax=Psychrobacillus sp. AK 1817 TaxID=2303505 RepID=UPI001244CB1E|nr:acetylglutamate kinase [Psychrobacillus sp. AK 1817]QEY20729.1 acetylglutamate kinase [Psychrobacillus sp. AK 1817]